ncbi:hypothetical protein [Staphylococcus agnetis]|uniref:hypothetical protein n=1 Tax=Staphylococcus agnetis TaxID=985762 RepID=UPI0004E38390|nr:hypothetical protein [Staphylococcus agnetis]KFE42002.1 hypothetical protein SAGN_04215 [Staphylococcus agnetis]NJH65617.1 hypothetical protein [Staphylococcus agnetis]NJH97880.1 hypothetical protein [Staphylococcus agnetis]PTH43089.1 hypothetical protein BU587_11895 [Staphylococcus agnetis]PTH74610.1 hypothetical protein BU581_01140 [Staphylococcus agnetis]
MVSDERKLRKLLLVGSIVHFICILLYTFIAATLPSISKHSDIGPLTLFGYALSDPHISIYIILTLYICMVALGIIYFKFGLSNSNVGIAYLILGVLVLYYSPIAGFCWIYVGARLISTKVLNALTVTSTIIIGIILLAWMVLGLPIVFILGIHDGLQGGALEPSLFMIFSSANSGGSSLGFLLLLVLLMSLLGGIYAFICTGMVHQNTQKCLEYLKFLCVATMTLSYTAALFNIAAILFTSLVLKRRNQEMEKLPNACAKISNSE